MMKRVLLLCSAILLGGWASQAQAAMVFWDIDSSQSWVRLNLPLNTGTSLDGVSVTVRLRDAGNGTWSDAGGRRTNLEGTLKTALIGTGENVTNATLIYKAGQHNAFALENSSFRPNPAQFDPNATNGDNPNGQFTGSGTAPAAFAVRVNAAALGGLITLTMGYLAIRDVEVNAGGSVALSGGGGSLSGGGSTFGVQDGSVDIDGISSSLVGQPIPDTLGLDLGDLIGGDLESNSGGTTITSLGGLNRRLDQVINIALVFDIDGVILNGSIQGHIRAYGTVPEPASMSLLGLAVSMTTFRRRRRR